MISVVVRDYANAATYALYEGAEKLEILDRLPRIIRTPLYGITLPIVAAANVFIETVTPLFQTIESVVFTILSAVSTIYYSLPSLKRSRHFGSYSAMDPSTAAKLTLINLNEALRNAVRFIGKVVISPLNFIAQLYHLFTIDDLTQSSSFISLYAQYDQDPPGTRIESLRLAGFLSRSKAPFSNFSEIGFNTIQVSLYNGAGDFSWKHSLLGRIVAIPVIAIDTALEVLKPLIAAVETIVKAILIVPVMIIWHIYQGDRISRDVRVGTFFNSFNYAIDYLAQSVSMLVLSPINLIVQLGKALKNPSRLSPIMAQTGTTFLKSEGDDKKSNANIRFEGLYCIGQKQQKYISKHGTMIAELEKSYATGYISLSRKRSGVQSFSFDDD